MEASKIVEKFKDIADAFTAKTAAVTAVLFMSVISPGSIVLLRYRPHEFGTWELSRIVFTSAILGVPSVMLCTIFLFIGGDASDMESEKGRQALLMAGACLSALIFYMLHTATLLGKPSIGLRQFLVATVAVHWVFAMIAIFTAFKNRYVRHLRRKNAARTFCPEI